MSLINEYMSDRRKKKLEEVTRALEQLKHENVATDALKPKSTLSTSVSHPPMRTGKDLLFIGILLICVVVLVITSFYYRSQYSKLNDNYQEKTDKLKELENDVSKERDRLEADIEDLEDQIDDLEAEISAKTTELENLTRTVTN